MSSGTAAKSSEGRPNLRLPSPEPPTGAHWRAYHIHLVQVIVYKAGLIAGGRNVWFEFVEQVLDLARALTVHQPSVH